MPKSKEKVAPKSKEQIVGDLKQKDIQVRVERFNKKMDIILSEEQFAIKLILKTNPNTLEVNPAIQLVDLKYAEQKA